MRRLLLYFSFIALLGCGSPNPVFYSLTNSQKVTITQGIWGTVFFWEGDFTPGSVTGTIKPVQRTIYVYEPANRNDVLKPHPYGTFYSEILTTKIDSTMSDGTGFFELNLKPGKYSIFIREDNLFYANGSDEKGIIFPAIVLNDSITEIQLDINYKSYW